MRYTLKWVMPSQKIGWLEIRLRHPLDAFLPKGLTVTWIIASMCNLCESEARA